MAQTFFEKWRHRVRDAWLVLTGQAWVGYGNPADWQYLESDLDRLFEGDA